MKNKRRKIMGLFELFKSKAQKDAEAAKKARDAEDQKWLDRINKADKNEIVDLWMQHKYRGGLEASPKVIRILGEKYHKIAKADVDRFFADEEAKKRDKRISDLEAKRDRLEGPRGWVKTTAHSAGTRVSAGDVEDWIDDLDRTKKELSRLKDQKYGRTKK